MKRYKKNIIRRRWKDRKGPWSATRLRVHSQEKRGKFQVRLTVSEVVMVLKSPDLYFWCFWSSETEPFWGPCAIHWFMEAKSAMRWRTVKRWRCPSHFNCYVSCHQATCYLDPFSMYSRTNVSIYMYICTQTLFQVWIDMGPDVQLPHGVANVI